MYTIEDLFDERGSVGIRVEQILIERNITKADLSNKTGVSRPTIDKLLAGTLTSKKNYEKHISKILNFLEIVPDVLLGKTIYKNNRTRSLRNILKYSIDNISKLTNIPIERLEQIEAGEDATISELRDIALYLSTSVKDLLGKSFFETQISELDYFIENDANNKHEISGFWGHLGLLLNNTKDYLWFPITSKTRESIYQSIENERLVIPCMNNKVLLLNIRNVKEILLLDEACDQPAYTNWDSNVSCGEIPLVISETLDDIEYKELDNTSNDFRIYLEKVIENKKWSEEDIYDMLNYSKIYFADGKLKEVNIEFDQYNSILDEIFNVYSFEDSEFYESILKYTDVNGCESFINVDNISMLEMPLLKVEEKIVENCIKGK